MRALLELHRHLHFWGQNLLGDSAEPLLLIESFIWIDSAKQDYHTSSVCTHVFIVAPVVKKASPAQNRGLSTEKKEAGRHSTRDTLRMHAGHTTHIADG